MAEKNVNIKISSFKIALSAIGLDVQSLKFTKKGILKEFCIRGVWYVINLQERFTAFLRNIIEHPIRPVEKLPKWFSVRPYVITTYWQQKPTVH